MNKTFIKLTNAAITVMVLAACSPNANLPTVSGNPSSNQTAAQPNSSSTAAQASVALAPASQNPPAVKTKSAAASELQTDLTAIHEDEAVYQDSLSVASQGGFSTQMLDESLELEADAEVNAEGTMPVPPAGRPGLRQPIRQEVRQEVRQELRPRRPLERRELPRQQAQDRRQEVRQDLRQGVQLMRRHSAMLAAQAAITFNADGTITLNPKAFKTEFHAAMDAKKDKIQQRVDELKPKLKAAKELAKDKAQQLKRKNFVVRHSDKVTTENADGSVTETMTIEFKNERTGVTRNTWVSTTKMGDKVLKVEYKLEATTPAYQHNATRVVTHNEDGSKSVLINSSTSWKNGKTREVSQERFVDAQGQVSGNGTITVKLPDGTEKTKTFQISITPGGEVTTTGSETGSDAEVVIDENANGDATIVVEENGETAAAEVDLEVEAETDATAEDSSETENAAADENAAV